MTEVAPFAADERSIAKYLGLNPQDPRSHAALAVCQRYRLDPILKHVVVIPKGGVYVTRDGLLHVAHMSGELDGIVLEEQGENDDEWWAVVSVYRKDMRFPFKFRGRYSKASANKQYGPEMALKVAESLALRRAFDVSGLPVEEERHAAADRVAAVPKPVTRIHGETVDTETGEITDEVEPEIVDAEVLSVDEVADSFAAELAPEPETPRMDLVYATEAQKRMIFRLIKKLGLDKDDALATLSEIAKHPIVSSDEIQKSEASRIITELKTMAGEGDE